MYQTTNAAMPPPAATVTRSGGVSTSQLNRTARASMGAARMSHGRTTSAISSVSDIRVARTKGRQAKRPNTIP